MSKGRSAALIRVIQSRRKSPLLEYMVFFGTVTNMNPILQNVVDTAKQLPEREQQELAAQLDEMITERKIAIAEADIKAGRVRPLDEAFDELEKRYDG